ncbi:MAG: heme-binding protein [Nitrospirales bacterium]|nr:MAG: heme-binding protein [Nitrospirales bacterium]
MKKRVLIGIGMAILVLGIIQLIPVDRVNPAIVADIPAPPPIKSILKRACYDCHSHETVWPWYSNVAPVSWLLAWDVHEGREELNFSNWDRYSGKKRMKKLKEIIEEMDEGEMPPWFYVPLHPEARLSPQDRNQLRQWVSETSPETDHHDDG